VKIGPSFVTMTIGAILAFAVNAHISGFNVRIAGAILLIAGAVAVAYNVRMARIPRRTDIIEEPGHTTYLEPADQEDVYPY
jgi:putative Mn2+ efflux pump MntP